MNEMSVVRPQIKAMSKDSLERVAAIEEHLMGLPQLELTTEHVIHGGMYARTIIIPAGAVITGVFIEVPTMLIVQGDTSVMVNDADVRLTGYNVIPASKGRKQVFVAHSDTVITMIFATQAKSVEDAENEFTNEADRLVSRMGGNNVIITGE